MHYQWRDTPASENIDSAINEALNLTIAYPVLDVVSAPCEVLTLRIGPHTSSLSLCHCTLQIVAVRSIDTALRSRRPFGEIHVGQYSVSHPP